jgi:hypothetical protein
MMFRSKTQIERLCDRSRKWMVVSYDKLDSYQLRTTSGRTIYEIGVRHHPERKNTRFQCWLPIRFPLDNPPSGLFGRLLMRSWELAWSAWVVNISGSCEAGACVSALVPNAALDAELFNDICGEQAEEVAAFHKELRDKFNYAAMGGGFAAPPPRPWDAGTSVPQLSRGGPPRQITQW